MNLAGNRKIMAATAAQNAITLKGSTEIVTEFFCNVFIMHIVNSNIYLQQMANLIKIIQGDYLSGQLIVHQIPELLSIGSSTLLLNSARRRGIK